jgi:GLPGLI family protein
MFRQKLLILLLNCILFVPFITSAQSQRFAYEYTFKPDTLQQDKTVKELMNLDVNADGSYFYSAALNARDSMFAAEFEKGKRGQSMHIDLRTIRKPKVNWRIAKMYPAMQTEFHGSVNAVNLGVKETLLPEWKIVSETKILEGFKAQKAVTFYKGRNWTVWFTEEIQIHDGPYKFSGLPGLVLQAEDDHKYHVFMFVGSRKLAENTSLKDKDYQRVYVDPKKYNRLWNEYVKDPARNIKIIHSSSGDGETIIYNSDTGQPMSKETLIRNKEQGMQKILSETNLCIECKLYRIDQK